jgi:hypothetical protein
MENLPQAQRFGESKGYLTSRTGELVVGVARWGSSSLRLESGARTAEELDGRIETELPSKES